jgi:TatA/E family protein of Tat protein translocase
MKFMQPWVLILILLALFILFGPKRLPDLRKSMRKGMRAFKEESHPEDENRSDGSSSASRPDSEHSDSPKS